MENLKQKLEDKKKQLQEVIEIRKNGVFKNSDIETIKIENQLIEEIQILRQFELEEDHHKVTENTSDGYHTFKELYDFRSVYNALLFNEWSKQKGDEEFHDVNMVTHNTKYSVHKSWNHNDGKPCFDGGWFIVVAKLPSGQISNHYPADRWNGFKVPETSKVLFPFDGHTGHDVLKRLEKELV
jgi:hypothetical protein